MPNRFYLPDTMVTWPWKTRTNPHADEVEEKCVEWCNAFPMMTKAYKKLKPDHLLVVSLFVLVIILVDDCTDAENADVARKTADLVKDAFEHSDQPRPAGEGPIGEIVRRFWQFSIGVITANVQVAFLKHFDEFLDSIVTQAGQRDEDVRLSVDKYLKLRRDNVGVMPFFPFLRTTSGPDLPEEIWDSAVIAEMTGHIIDMYIFDNDTISYGREYALGDTGHNIVTLLMQEHGIDVGSAVAWATARHAAAQKAFKDGLERLPSLGSHADAQVKEYLNGLGYWIRAYHVWSFKIERYFDGRGDEVKASRLVQLKPPASSVQSSAH
ncbi:terpenoid synthase [Coniophora puteana RWD-64-598 SS2]|uniref:Terpene synthase n=1 Tax=Coniophora puteana (strain RWD-64-598) TaxID=741705 RepID=A0A5M3MWF6_CONPW|nr:terpenoid synthase [Coniophora puteana RWD-64-598 SS2]EIW83446.1 terpenoid synthase [Coniophora puteana RWD-64-598 SS2]